MNAARKALINIQTASPGLPVGRFHPQLAIIADFFDTLVNLQIERDSLHRQLTEAHERFGNLLGNMVTPPASQPDQAQTAVSGITISTGSVDPQAVANILPSWRPQVMVMDDRDMPEHAPSAPENFFAELRAKHPPAKYPLPEGYRFDYPGFTYEAFRNVGWNDKQLKEQGWLKLDPANFYPAAPLRAMCYLCAFALTRTPACPHA